MTNAESTINLDPAPFPCYLLPMNSDGTASGQDHATAQDVDLVRAIAAGDDSALSELFKRYQSRVLNVAYRFLGRQDEAELVVQDTFMKIWHSAGKYRGSSQAWTWIYRIAVNLCNNFKSRNRNDFSELDETLPAGPEHEPAEAFHRKEQESIIRRALDALPDDQKMVVVLTRFEGLSYIDTAQVMGKSTSATAMLLLRAKETLRVKLTPFLKQGKFSPL